MTRTKGCKIFNSRSTMTNRSLTIFLLLTILGVVIVRGQFQCPEDKGFFPDPEQCDLYYSCVDGRAEEKLCKDGLVFRDDNPKKDFCDLPANVPCGDRTLLRKFITFFYIPIFFSPNISQDISRTNWKPQSIFPFFFEASADRVFQGCFFRFLNLRM